MKGKGIIVVFLVVAALQLIIPGSMIAKREHALRYGQAFKFRTAPVDPYDAFRGRYVALRFEQRFVGVTTSFNYLRGEKMYATIVEDDEGYASFSVLSKSRPVSEPYLSTRLLYVSRTNVHIHIPFDRFYMDEHEAPKAERAYWKNSSRSNRNAYVQIRIEKGFGVIEDLYIDQTPIREFLAIQPREKNNDR